MRDVGPFAVSSSLSTLPLDFLCVCTPFEQIAVSTPDVFDAAAAVEKTKYDVSGASRGSRSYAPPERIVHQYHLFPLFPLPRLDNRARIREHPELLLYSLGSSLFSRKYASTVDS